MLYDCVYTVSAFIYLLVYNWVLVLYEAQRILNILLKFDVEAFYTVKRLTKVEKELNETFDFTL